MWISVFGVWIVFLSIVKSQSLSAECGDRLTEVTLEVSPELLKLICADNSPTQVVFSSESAFWINDVYGFCTSFDLNIGTAKMNQIVTSQTLSLQILKNGDTLDAAQIVTTQADAEGVNIVTVWGHQNTRVVLKIVHECYHTTTQDSLQQTTSSGSIGNQPFIPGTYDVATNSYSGGNSTTTTDDPTKLYYSQYPITYTTTTPENRYYDDNENRVEYDTNYDSTYNNEDEKEDSQIHIKPETSTVPSENNLAIAKLEWMEQKRREFEGKRENLTNYPPNDWESTGPSTQSTDNVQNSNEDMIHKPNTPNSENNDISSNSASFDSSLDSQGEKDSIRGNIDRSTLKNLPITNNQLGFNKLVHNNLSNKTISKLDSNTPHTIPESNIFQQRFGRIPTPPIVSELRNNSRFTFSTAQKGSYSSHYHNEEKYETKSVFSTSYSFSTRYDVAVSFSSSTQLYYNVPSELPELYVKIMPTSAVNTPSTRTSDTLIYNTYDTTPSGIDNRHAVIPEVLMSSSVYYIGPAAFLPIENDNAIPVENASDNDIDATIKNRKTTKSNVKPSSASISYEMNVIQGSDDKIGSVAATKSLKTDSTNTVSPLLTPPTVHSHHDSSVGSPNMRPALMHPAPSFSSQLPHTDNVGDNIINDESKYSPQSGKDTTKIDEGRVTTSSITLLYPSPETGISSSYGDATLVLSSDKTSLSTDTFSVDTTPPLSVLYTAPTPTGKVTLVAMQSSTSFEIHTTESDELSTDPREEITISTVAPKHEKEGDELNEETFWPVVAALVVGIPSVLVFGIAIVVIHRRRPGANVIQRWEYNERRQPLASKAFAMKSLTTSASTPSSVAEGMNKAGTQRSAV